MARFIIPTANAVKDILKMIYGEELKVSPHNDASVSDRHLATYVSDDKGIVAVCACDDEFLTFSGAALSMVPCGVASEMLSKKDFSNVILNNFHEVMNILSRVLMSDNSPHLRLNQTLTPDLAEPAIAQLGSDRSVAGFSVDIPRYGSGTLVFLVS